MRKAGCLVALVILVLMSGEFWVYWKVARHFDEFFGVALGVLILSVIGYKILRWRISAMPVAMLSGKGGPAFIGLIGGVLIVIPGMVTGAIGLVMQAPPIQRIFGRYANTFVAAMARQAMKKAGMAGFPGMPGGFPGMPGSAFPFGKPDERLRQFGGKTRDASVDKD